MKREKWIIGVRNKCANLAVECDSAAAIEGARMTQRERELLQNKLRDIVKWIDDKI